MATKPVSHVPDWRELESIVDSSRLRAATAGDAIGGLHPQRVAEPADADEVARVLSAANRAGLAVAVRGGGSKMEWGNAPRSLELVMSTRALNRVLEHAAADMTATVEPGCTVADFQRVLAQRGQRLALDPLFPERATMGGILATNDSGALRTRFGSLRDLVIGMRVALSDGTLARSGGKVVKNVAGYDLPKLFTGSLGTLGVIVEATFRLYPLPQAERTITFAASDCGEANRFVLALMDSTLTPVAIQVRAGRDRNTQVDLRFEGTAAGIEAQVPRAEALALARGALADAAVWHAREELWMRAEPGCIAAFSVLPAQIAALCQRIAAITSEAELDWIAVIQAAGTGVLRLDGGPERLVPAIDRLRSDLEPAGGSLAVRRCPDALRSRIEAWGSPGSALPLMRRVKEQFDPAGILNPGRFVGGI